MSCLICPPRFQISILKSKLSNLLLINQRGLQIDPNRGGGLRIGPQSKVTDDLPRNYFSVILLFPEGRNGQMAFTANGYIIRLLSPEIILRLTFLTSIDWHLSIFLPYSFIFFVV